MKKILVPCDFSEPAVQAFKFAVDIAKQSHGEIHLVHAIELPTLHNSSVALSFEGAFLKDMRANVDKNFRKMKEKWADPSTAIKSSIEFGGIQAAIKKSVDKIKPDVVVIGTHGASGLKEFTVGSNTEKVVRSSTVPVIALRKAPKAIRNIVFPTRPDLDQEDLTMRVKVLQEFFKAKLHVLYVNTPSVFRRDVELRPALDEFSKRFMLKNFTINVYNDTSEEEGIINFVTASKADMVAMRTHGRRGIGHLAAGSIAEDVVNHINCPIWTFKIK